MTSNQQTYRFKFSKKFTSILIDFANLHKFECPYDFKISWDKWIDINSRSIEQEKELLNLNGYKGNMNDKMYISVRYYYKLKHDTKTDVKKRKVYVGIDKTILDIIDVDINTNVINQQLKPAVGFKNFMNNDNYKKEIFNEKNRLFTNNNVSNDDFNAKIKKTYKNRYFIIRKRIE
jgi:hypothetical protein